MTANYTLGLYVEPGPYKNTDNYFDFIEEVTGSKIVSDYYGFNIDHFDDTPYISDNRCVYFLLERNGKIGFACQNTGTCSHCDDLLSCNTEEDFTEVGKMIAQHVRWFDSVEELNLWADNLEEGMLPDNAEQARQVIKEYNNPNANNEQYF